MCGTADDRVLQDVCRKNYKAFTQQCQRTWSLEVLWQKLPYAPVVSPFLLLEFDYPHPTDEAQTAANVDLN